jgi:hypothetical protein
METSTNTSTITSETASEPGLTAVAAPVKVACVQPGGGETHEPPVIITGGSLNISLDQELVRDGFNPPDSPRPFKYRWTHNTDNGHIAIVRVVTEDIAGNFSCEAYKLPEMLGCKLRIWLHQLKPAGGPFDYEQVLGDAPPHLIIEGNRPRLDIDKELLGPNMSHDFGHPFRYEHPGFDRHFRIAKWDIVSPASPAAPVFQSIEGGSFKLYVSFYEVE